MFYIKQNFGYAEVITEMHDDNIFTRCPECGCEVQVDLAEVFKDEHIDFYGTTVLCADCTKKHQGKGGGI